MSLLDWFAERRRQTSLNLTGSSPFDKERQVREIADGLWQKCPACDTLTYTKDLQQNWQVCPSCGHHHRITAPERLEQLLDPGSWQPLDEHLAPTDPLHFFDQKPYSERLATYQERTQLKDAVLTGLGSLEGIPVAIGVMDFRFMGGSMGSVVGEKIARQTVLQVPLGWADAVFLDPFSPSVCPELWTVDFLRAVAERMRPTGILATYSCAAAVRAALLEAGLFIGSTPPVGRPWPGTVASPQPDHLPPLSPMEWEHLKTRAAVPYRDPTLKGDRAQIRLQRQREQQASPLEPTSAWKRRWPVQA